MFNKRIQEEFDARVKGKGLDGVRVQTFHSLGNAICSWAVCSWAVKQGLLPRRPKHRTFAGDGVPAPGGGTGGTDRRGC
jgi:hypothetical protein